MSTRFLLSGLLALFVCLPATAQTARVVDDDGWCRNDRWNNNGETYCEVREVTLDARDLLEVDGGTNGGIQVRGWDRNEIQIRAKVQGNARSEERAQELAEAVTIRTGSVIKADTPNSRNREWTSVSYRIYVPHNTDLELETHNGGIDIAEVTGDIDFDALNGGVTLERLAGDVRGSTTNGGLDVELDGDAWAGRGLDVKTTNGGVTVYVPQDYNADFETGTVNGRLNLDFPMMVSGRIDRTIRTTLGDGGAPVRVRTTNGGVDIRRGG